VMRFSLRSSAYLCVLCDKRDRNAEIRRDTQRAAEKTVLPENFFIDNTKTCGIVCRAFVQPC
jgi:hypothetical protein